MTLGTMGSVVILVLLGLLLLALLWPRQGLMWWVRRQRRAAARATVEDALKYSYDLQTQGKPVTAAALAPALNQSVSQTARLLGRMEAQGLVHRTDVGFLLSQKGEDWALQVLRAHRLWERYLADEEGYPLEEVHEEAHRREHTTTPEMADGMEEQLGFPRRDPHGDPIPSRSGEITREYARPLTEWTLNRPATISHIEDEPTAVFAQIVAQGLAPGMTVRVRERDERRLRVQANGGVYTLAPVVAANIHVIPIPPQRMPLSRLGPGQRGTIISLTGSGATHRRMLDLGLVPGAQVTVVRQAPLGDPVEYRVKGASLSLRRREAEKIVVDIAEEV
ncbi:MAG: DtxR family transcriptional regulator [Anaerolineae bacterium]